MEQTIINLEKKQTDFEDRSRRNNLLVFGLAETTDQTSELLSKSVVEDLFQYELDVNVLSIERIHRIGCKHQDKPRPVIMKFIDCREKTNALKNCSKLKGLGISVSEEFSPATRQIRKQLLESTADAKRAGSKVKLFYDKVKIDNDMFKWDNKTMQMIPCYQRSSSTNGTLSSQH